MLETVLSGTKAMSQRAAAVLAGAWIGLAAASYPAMAQDLAVPDEILSLIEEVVGPPNTAARRGLEFEINSPDGRYREGDFAEFRVRAPDYDAFIYLDYYQIDGNVVHILPGPGGSQAVPRRQEIEVGTPESGVSYEILPPFGRELLVLMVAPQPLFNRPRREFEFATVYLEDLRRGIARLEQSWPGQLAVIYRAIQTHPADAFIAEAPQPEPQALLPQPEPRASPPQPEPLVVKPAPEPLVVQPAPEPPVVQPAPEPLVVEPAPEPLVIEPAPQVVESAPEPVAQAGEAELPSAPVAEVTPPAAPQVAAAPEPPPSPAPALPAVQVPALEPAPEPVVEPEPEPEPEPQQMAAVPAAPAPPEPADEVTVLRQRIGDLNKRVQLSPNDMVLVRELATTYRDHAQLMFDRGEYEKANLSLSMVMALDVTNAELVTFAEDLKARIAVQKTYEEGLTQIGLGQVALAYESFQDVLNLDPGNTEARKRMSELAPEVTELYHKEALSAARRQDLDRALEIWDKVLTISPDFEEAKLKRVEALRRKKRLEQLPSVQ